MICSEVRLSDLTNMKEVAYNPDSLSHHIDNIIYWVTQGIIIDDVRYSIV